MTTRTHRENLIAIGAPIDLTPRSEGSRGAARPVRLPPPICLLHAPAPEPIEWAVEGLILHREIAMIAASGGHFKSTLMLALAGAVAGGTPALRVYRTGAAAPILFVSEEDSRDVILNRMEALIRGMGWDRETVLRNIHVLALDGARLADSRWQQHLCHSSEHLGARIVFFDPLTELLDGEGEMSPDSARPVIQFLRRLAATTAVVIAHHLNKPNPKGGTVSLVDRVRGAGSWTNAARAVYNVALDGDSLRLECSKSNRVRRPAPIDIAFRIESEPGNDAQWYSATFSAAGSRKRPEPNRLSETALQALRAIERCQEGVISWTAWGEESGLSKQRLSEARKVLLDRGLVQKEDSGRKLAGRAVWAYSITGEGTATLTPVAPSPRVRVESGSSPTRDSGTSSPPRPHQVRFEAGVPHESAESASPAPPYRGPALRGLEQGRAISESGPGLEPLGDDYWHGLPEDSTA